MKRRFPTILAIFVTLLFAILAANRLDWTDTSTFLTSLDLRWLDTKFQLRGSLVPGNEVVIVGLDDRTMDALRSARTFERKHVAELVDKISAAGPRVIGFDILYEDEDASDPLNDQLFAEAIERAGNVVMAVRLDLESTTGESGEQQELDPGFRELVIQKQVFPVVRQRGTNTGASLIQGFDPSMNLPIHNQAAATFGFVNFHPDAQGFLRYQPQFIEWGGRLYPSLDLQLLKIYLGAPSVTIGMQGNRVEEVQVGNYVIPTDRFDRYMVNFNGEADTHRRVSWIDVQEGRVDPEVLRDKIVIVGPYAVGLGDVVPTSFDPVLPGVELHANVLDNILSQRYLVRNTTTTLLDMAFILIFGVGVAIFLPKMGATRSVFYSALGLLLFTAFNVWIFLQLGWVLSYVYPGLALAATSGSLISYKYLTEEREKKRTKQVFSHYLDQAVIDQVVDQPEKLQLGGEKHNLTVLFSDIRGFSSFSEKMTPQELVGFLNTYFNAMTDIIFKYQGTLDKLIGDAVMCFWGHPVKVEDHPLRATIAAMEMMSVVRHLQETVQLPDGQGFDIRIGVNTGEMVVGNMGSESRFSYTVMGDEVNLGARLESLGKFYGVNMLISGATYEKVQHRIYCRELDRVKVKGKEQAVTIYEPLGLHSPEAERRQNERRGESSLGKKLKAGYVTARHGERRRGSNRRMGSPDLVVDPIWKEIRPIFDRALELYRQADFDGADRAFDQVLALRPEDGPATMLKARIEKNRVEYAHSGGDFDPVYKFDQK